MASAVSVKRVSLRLHMNRDQLLKPMGGVGRRGGEEARISRGVMLDRSRAMKRRGWEGILLLGLGFNMVLS